MLKKSSLLISFVFIACCLLFAQDDSLKQSMKRGEVLYAANCSGCHMPMGEGIETVFPPLAKTSYLKNQNRAIGIILNGQEGEITVNGKTYNNTMAAMPQLSDQEVADILNFVNNSWDNKYPKIKATQVKSIRK